MTDFSHHIALVANGDSVLNDEVRKLIQRHPIIYAVDGGLNRLDELFITPSLIIGDFDSVDSKILSKYKEVETVVFEKEKDETDLELAIDIAFNRGAEEITIYGGFLGRTDHFFANILLLEKKVGFIHLESSEEWVTAITGTFELQCRHGQIISFFSLSGASTGVITDGLKWELKGETVDNTFFSLSNVAMKEKVTIKVGSGMLLLCVKK